MTYIIHIGGWINGQPDIEDAYETDDEKVANDMFDVLDENMDLFRAEIAFICICNKETGEVLRVQDYNSYNFRGDELKRNHLYRYNEK